MISISILAVGSNFMIIVRDDGEALRFGSMISQSAFGPLFGEKTAVAKRMPPFHGHLRHNIRMFQARERQILIVGEEDALCISLLVT